MNNFLKILAAITMVLVSTASAVFIMKAQQPPSQAAATVASAPAPAPAAAAAPAPAPVAATSPAAAPTPGASSIITTSAWNAMKDEKYDDAVTAAQKCITTYKQQALDEQKSLTAAPTDKDEVNKLWALNDVGTSYFILGQAYEKLNKPKDAADAYKFLVDNLSYSQCWDPKGWFWKPATAAQKQLNGLKLDTLN